MKNIITRKTILVNEYLELPKGTYLHFDNLRIQIEFTPSQLAKHYRIHINGKSHRKGDIDIFPTQSIYYYDTTHPGDAEWEVLGISILGDSENEIPLTVSVYDTSN